jgi:hypothetical protein
MVGCHKRGAELHRDLHRAAENGSKVSTAFLVPKWEAETIRAADREPRFKQKQKETGPPGMAALEFSSTGYGFGAGGLGAEGRVAEPAGLAAPPGAETGAATLDWEL